MTQEEYTNDLGMMEANFEFVENPTIEAIFEINPNIQDLNYTHYQVVASDTWVINHNMGKYPSVTIVAENGDLVQADVNYKDDNNLSIYFIGSFKGIAYLN